MSDPRYLHVPRLRGWFIVCLVLFLLGSFVPLAWKVEWGLHGAQHFRVHVAAFSLLGMLAFLNVNSWHKRLAAMLALVGMAVVIEIFQTVFFGNALEWSDVEADGYGMLIAFLLAEVLRRAGGRWRARS